MVRLRETGLSIERIAGHMRIGVGTVVRALRAIGKVQTVKQERVIGDEPDVAAAHAQAVRDPSLPAGRL